MRFCLVPFKLCRSLPGFSIPHRAWTFTHFRETLFPFSKFPPKHLSTYTVLLYSLLCGSNSKLHKGSGVCSYIIRTLSYYPRSEFHTDHVTVSLVSSIGCSDDGLDE